MLQGGLVDWDGTLANTPMRQYKWFSHWAKVNNNKKFNLSFEEFLPLYNKILDEKNVQAFYDEFELPCDMNNRNHPVWQGYEYFKSINPVELYVGAEKALKEVWEMGRLSKDPRNNKAMRLAINTTNSWKSIYPELIQHNILHYFDSHCTDENLKEFEGSGNHNAIKKPSKVSVALMLNILDSDGEMTFHIDDTVAGLKASNDVRRFGGLKSENLITIGAGQGFEGYDHLNRGYKTNGTTIHFNEVIEDIRQWPDVIKKYM